MAPSLSVIVAKPSAEHHAPEIPKPHKSQNECTTFNLHYTSWVEKYPVHLILATISLFIAVSR